MEESMQLKLEVFEGPLDLLMHLIEKHKIDIYDIPIAQITEQYMAYLSEMEAYNIELSSEFLVMASQLLLIKSRMLLPKPPAGEDEFDPRQELVDRLVAYKLFKEVSGQLKEWAESSKGIYYKDPDEAVLDIQPEIILTSTTEKLVKAFIEVLTRERPEKPKPVYFERVVPKPAITVSESKERLGRILSGKKQLSFLAVFDGLEDRGSMISYFLAVLEFLKDGRIRISEKGEEVYLVNTGKEETHA